MPDRRGAGLRRARRRWAATGGSGPVACVLGEVDLVRALALAGIRSAVLIGPGNPVRWSRAVTEVLPWADPWRQPELVVERLLAFGRRQASPPVLLYDGDWDLLLVSRFRRRLGEAFRFVVPDAELVEQLVDKQRFQELARRLGLPVPRALPLTAGADPADLDLRFPAVVKPLTRQHASWRPIARGKALQVGSAAELAALTGRLAPDGVDVLVQEIVPGPESRIASHHVYVDADGAIAGEFTGRKVRTYPAQFGYTTALEITRDEETAALGREVVRALDLRGVAKLDFKRDDEGRLHLLEINARFNLWHHPGAVAGVNLPALVHADLVGAPRPPVAAAPASVRWCNLAHDLPAARGAGVGPAAWVGWVARCRAHSGFAWDDPLPLPRAALWRVGGTLARRVAAARARTGAAPGAAQR